MKLTDLLPLEKWVELEEEIHARCGLDTNVFGIDGVRITNFKNWVNRLCPAIKDTDKGQAFICAVAHMNLAAQAKNSKSPVIEECDAGLMKLVVPIFVGDEFVGAVGACGVLLDDGEIDDFMISKTTEIDEEEIASLATGISSITREAAEDLAAFITARIKKIVGDYEKRSAR
jgi:ligand-binding sensor protein